MNHCSNCGTEARIIDEGCGDPSCCGVTLGRDCACSHNTELCSGEGDDACPYCSSADVYSAPGAP